MNESCYQQMLNGTGLHVWCFSRRCMSMNTTRQCLLKPLLPWYPPCSTTDDSSLIMSTTSLEDLTRMVSFAHPEIGTSHGSTSIFSSCTSTGKGCVFSYDPVGSYEREVFRAAGSAGPLLQPLLDNQVTILAEISSQEWLYCFVRVWLQWIFFVFRSD